MASSAMSRPARPTCSQSSPGSREHSSAATSTITASTTIENSSKTSRSSKKKGVGTLPTVCRMGEMIAVVVALIGMLCVAQDMHRRLGSNSWVASSTEKCLNSPRSPEKLRKCSFAAIRHRVVRMAVVRWQRMCPSWRSQMSLINPNSS